MNKVEELDILKASKSVDLLNDIHNSNSFMYHAAYSWRKGAREFPVGRTLLMMPKKRVKVLN